MYNFSVVINTLNSEKTLKKCLDSVKDAAEIIVVDMYSEDKTVEIAKKYTEKIYFHDKTGYVEPARNFAIQKANYEWILVLDSDEVVTPFLKNELQKITSFKDKYNYYKIPRKNIIFGNWVKHTGWWPDYQLRFFKKGTVSWHSTIHGDPPVKGEGHSLPADEEYAFTHYNYDTVSDYLARLDRYTTIQARELSTTSYKFKPSDPTHHALKEFNSRFFYYEGYKDGYLGLYLSILQAVSEFIKYVKVGEIQKQLTHLPENNLEKAFKSEFNNAKNEISHWLQAKKFINKFKFSLLKRLNF